MSIIKLIKVYCSSLSVKQKLKAVNIWRSYKQDRCSLVYFVRLANTLLKDEESARDNHLFACNFAKYSQTLKHLIDGVNCIGD